MRGRMRSCLSRNAKEGDNMKYRSLYYRRKEFQRRLRHMRWHCFKENMKTLLVTVFGGIVAYMVFVLLLLFG